MPNLKERIEQLERVLDNEEPQQVFVIVCCATQEDVRLSHEFNTWVTHDEQMATVPQSPPHCCRVVYADCERERQARVRAATGQQN